MLLYVMSAPHSAQILTDMGESEAIVLLMGGRVLTRGWCGTAPREVGPSGSWRDARSSPFNPSRIHVSEPAFASCAAFWPSFKRKSASKGQVSDFLSQKMKFLKRELLVPHRRVRGVTACVSGCLKRSRFTSIYSGADILMWLQCCWFLKIFLNIFSAELNFTFWFGRLRPAWVSGFRPSAVGSLLWKSSLGSKQFLCFDWKYFLLSRIFFLLRFEFLWPKYFHFIDILLVFILLFVSFSF